jgi:hypothetical protein
MPPEKILKVETDSKLEIDADEPKVVDELEYSAPGTIGPASIESGAPLLCAPACLDTLNSHTPDLDLDNDTAALQRLLADDPDGPAREGLIQGTPAPSCPCSFLLSLWLLPLFWILGLGPKILIPRPRLTRTTRTASQPDEGVLLGQAQRDEDGEGGVAGGRNRDGKVRPRRGRVRVRWTTLTRVSCVQKEMGESDEGEAEASARNPGTYQSRLSESDTGTGENQAHIFSPAYIQNTKI